MLKIQEIREIIKLIDQSSIDKFTFESDGTKIKLEKKNEGATHQMVAQPQSEQPVQQAAPAAAEVKKEEPKQEVEKVEESPAAESKKSVDDASLHKIPSPMVGTFYKSSAPDAPAYVQKGDSVKADTIVCIVEAMKLFNEIEAEVSGEIVEILVEDGQLVEYGQPLFLVKQN
ncbi:acetyl-CoA carboxylase biotin carboxyl carrier protein [Sporosarcina saromensis]|uniref:Biotin carboxyl carrier protein of acetyl-CoA carboxylase n=1 Tax=Sporosarcina saromensis TaxID=359365 RepID=A0ABU4G576_9BACL|nr:acetyl-CoA carboxylase biotin carboxyl carrier protein [Sporosarcina saromensis]MDW0112125.1 acetyl-CoA carboxylase biotin carboxyl carrier protein [Sporosarcina saromensis]